MRRVWGLPSLRWQVLLARQPCESPIAIVIIMKTIQVTFDDGIHRSAKALASHQKNPLGELLRRTVATYLERHDDRRLPKRARRPQ